MFKLNHRQAGGERMNESPNLPFMQILMEGIQDMVFVVQMDDDNQFRYQFMNSAVLSRFHSQVNPINKTFRELFSQELSDELESQYKKAFVQKEIISFQSVIYDSKGKKHQYTETRLTPIIEQDGSCRYVVGIAKDITEEKKTHKLLEEKHLQQLSLYENNPDAIFTIDLAGFIQNVNEMASQLSGYMKKNLLGSFFFDYIDKEDREDAYSFFKDTFHKPTKSFRFNFLNSENAKIGSLIQFVPIKSSNRILGFFVMVKDMREMDKLADQYIEVEKNFRVIAENVQEVIVLMNDQKECLYISPSSKKMLGLTEDEMRNRFLPINVHPQYKEKVETEFASSIIDGKPYSMQLQLKHRDKGWIWTELTGTPVFNEQHIFRHMVLVIRDITSQKKNEDQLQYFAYHDSLTGLANRRYLQDKLTEMIGRKEKEGINYAVILLDIDDFKSINDTYGHEAGDSVILEFGKRLKEIAPERGLVARLGGDEFIICVEQMERAELEDLVEQIVSSIGAPWEIGGDTHTITTSIGIAVAGEENLSTTEILKMADEAMYEAKNAGKNVYQIYYA